LHALASILLQQFEVDTVRTVFLALRGLRPITRDALGAFLNDEPADDESEPDISPLLAFHCLRNIAFNVDFSMRLKTASLAEKNSI
jgi:hypothetical protein